MLSGQIYGIATPERTYNLVKEEKCVYISNAMQNIGGVAGMKKALCEHQEGYNWGNLGHFTDEGTILWILKN